MAILPVRLSPVAVYLKSDMPVIRLSALNASFKRRCSSLATYPGLSYPTLSSLLSSGAGGDQSQNIICYEHNKYLG